MSEDLSIWLDNHKKNDCILVLSIRNSFEISSIFSSSKFDELMLKLMDNIAIKSKIRFSSNKIIFAANKLKWREIAGDIAKQISSFSALEDNDLMLIPEIGCIDISPDNSYSDIAIKINILSDYQLIMAPHHFIQYSDYEQNIVTMKQNMAKANFVEKAIINNRLKFAFQPIIESHKGSVAYYECLLRIVQEDGKLVSIGPYIDICEQYNLIKKIDKLVIKMVVDEIINSSDIMLSFNISNYSIYDKDWLEYASQLMSDPAIASRIIMELTENAIHADFKTVSSFIIDVEQLGCQVAIDDFGTGYTSFRQLRSLPIDIIKIDGSFIRDIASNHDNHLFVKTLLEMSRGLGFKTVAEFVENGEIAKILLELNVDYMQGNYFSPAQNHRNWKSSNNLV